MGSLQKTALCLLLLFIFSPVCKNNFAEFSCHYNKTEYNKTAKIECNGTRNIKNVVIKRCQSCAEESPCPEILFNTMNSNETEKGRFQLERRKQHTVMHLQEVKVTDQGSYKWYLFADSGEQEECISLEITVPEAEPNLIRDGAKLTCLSPIGHPQRQIHWFDDCGNNLTSSAHLVSGEVERGLTSLTSTLNPNPSITSRGYCCTVLYDERTKRNKTMCMSAEGVADYLDLDPKTRKEHVATIVALVFLVLCCFAAVLYYKYRQRAEARGNIVDLIRTLYPVLRQYENTPNQDLRNQDGS
ncbi:CD276 antigen-like [Carettochelys insculpta]|uniref:CD276 antigen-like n=1 Tax=Carettochelys insculpta TaxID=44489 RepID=UPI003EBBFDB1